MPSLQVDFSLRGKTKFFSNPKKKKIDCHELLSNSRNDETIVILKGVARSIPFLLPCELGQAKYFPLPCGGGLRGWVLLDS